MKLYKTLHGLIGWDNSKVFQVHLDIAISKIITQYLTLTVNYFEGYKIQCTELQLDPSAIRRVKLLKMTKD